LSDLGEMKKKWAFLFKGRIIMRKFLLPVLILMFLLVSFTGCAKKEKKAHLSASIESYEYSSSTGYIDVYVRVVNDGEKDIDYYEIFYRVSYDSLTHDDWTNGLNLKTGQSRTEYTLTFIGTGKTVTAVTITDVEWKVY